MIIRKAFVLSAIIILSSAANLFAVDIDDGNIRLRINEKTGNYSLFYLTDPEKRRYEPLFYSREPDASYLSVNVGGSVYALGKSKDFSTTVQTNNGNPTVTYQSSFLTVTKTFTPVKTFSFSASNGIRLDITLHNTTDNPVSAGLRMLIDTNLGEGKIPFVSNNREITKELLIEDSSDQFYWISRNQNLSLMGTIANPFTAGAKAPDYVHIANWKRLDKAQWALDYVENRAFNYRPYFTNDSAVCYYYEPYTLEAGDSVTYTIFLTTEDVTWYNIGSAYDFSSYQTAGSTDNYSDPDYLLLLRMQEVLDRFLAGEILLNGRDLDEIEGNINRLKAKFNQLR